VREFDPGISLQLLDGIIHVVGNDLDDALHHQKIGRVLRPFRVVLVRRKAGDARRGGPQLSCETSAWCSCWPSDVSAKCGQAW